MSLTSEQQHLSALRTGLDTASVSLYKACIAVACNGLKLPEEDQLGPHERNLLEVRRLLFASKLQEAEAILMNFVSPILLLNGDRLFLWGQIHHRKGEQKLASEYMNYAADEYRSLGDFHRELRARVNGALCLSSLESVLVGDLYCLELEARRRGYSDIVANICRTRATELLIAEKYKQAITQAKDAAEFYLNDGYQDDRSVAILIAALASYLSGDSESALSLRDQVFVTEGKVQIYYRALEALFNHKIPSIPKGHSLERMKWPKLGIKKNSITAKIISALEDGPLTKEELIDLVWAPKDFNEAYIRRLYSAINQIRKDNQAVVVFNGERYELASR